MSKLTEHRHAGLAAVIAAVTAFSWGFILIKALGMPAPLIAFYRLSLGAVILSAAAMALRVPWPKHWGPVVGAGLSFGVHQLAFIAATQRTSVAIVTLMTAIQPLLVTLLSRESRRGFAALIGYSLLALLGVAVVVHANIHHASRSWVGDGLAVFNALCFTAYFLFAKRARTGGTATLTLTASFLAVALIVVLPALVLHGNVAPPTTHQATMLVVLVLGPGNGHLLLNWAHRRVHATLSSLLLAMIPALSSIWAHWWFDEPLTWRHLVGIALVVSAVEGVRRRTSDTPRG